MSEENENDDQYDHDEFDEFRDDEVHFVSKYIYTYLFLALSIDLLTYI